MATSSSTSATRRMLTLAGGAIAALVAREAFATAREADLAGQVALITGGSRGLGLALARELADEGCRLAICARDEAELERAAAELRGRGAEVLAIQCDVADQAAVNRMVAQVKAQFGQIDLLFTVAGVIQVGQLASMELEDFRQAMDIMFWGTLYPILAVLPEMKRRHAGRIVTITSIGGKVSVPHLLPYNAAKFAAVGLSEGLRAELADEGITVTTIVPGVMRTGSHLNAYFSGDREGQRDEYEVFAALASSPLAVGADRAARIILRATKRGEAEHIFPLPFSLIARLHGLAPELTPRLLAVADRLLPRGEAGPETVRGMEVEERIDSPVWKAATVLGREAAKSFDEYPGPTSVPDPDGHDSSIGSR